MPKPINHTKHPLNDEQCYEALLSRDVRFDGQFYTGVKTTGIYCRCICPAAKPKRKNVIFYPSAAAAELAGFRPCLRCRPALAPQLDIREPILQQAVSLIGSGFLKESSVTQLADKIGYSERQLRSLFTDRISCSPSQLHHQQRLATALQLLSNSDLSIADIAHASGFNSLRRMNDSFKQQYQLPPSSFRSRKTTSQGHAPNNSFSVLIPLPKDYNWRLILGFHRERAIKGIEQVSASRWQRLACINGKRGLISVSYNKPKHALVVESERSLLGELPRLLKHIDKLFDCKVPLATIYGRFAKDPVLNSVINQHSGLALAGTWSVWECMVRAIVGQLISVSAAATIHQRLIKATAEKADGYADFEFVFPTPQAIIEHPLEGLGLSKQKIAALKACAQAYQDKAFGGDFGVSLEQRLNALCKVKGIGSWTAQYIAMRGYKYPNAFPAGDLVLQKSAAGLSASTENRLSEKQLNELSKAWLPWRAYAAMLLWQHHTSLTTTSSAQAN